MKVWLYYRLSRDEDKELNSLTNQKKILEAYAKEKGFTVVGESFDDNVSGMHFNREGIEQLQDEVEKGGIDAVVVKDLSRLGRHKTQTAMFIDYLRQHRVRVLSVTENNDTDNEDDELMIGFKGIFNDMYCRDISKKIRAGFMQKQREGIVIIPPMGYYKDKNTGQVVIVEEQAEIVRRIYRLYLEGYGLKSIARMLNEEGVKSQGYYQEQLYGKNVGRNKPELARRFLWENTKVRRILTNEFYTGTLVCHKSYTSRINHVRKDIPEAEQFRHEGFVPAIIGRAEWEHVQTLLAEKTAKKVRASSGKPFHRYTGLIKCGDCGATFTCVGRHNNDKPGRHEYVCNGYHRYGKENCTSHRVDEADLDRLIREELISARRQLRKAYAGIEEDVKRWLSSRDNTEKKLKALESQLAKRLEDQKEILLERLRDREHASVYTEMLSECEADISRLGKEIRTLKDHDSAVKRARSEMKDGIALLDEMLDKGEISAASLRLLVEGITVWEKDGMLRIAITLKGNLRHHMDFYDEDGNLTDTAFEAMAEEMDSEDYAGFIEHLAEEAAAETAEETADYSKTA